MPSVSVADAQALPSVADVARADANGECDAPADRALDRDGSADTMVRETATDLLGTTDTELKTLTVGEGHSEDAGRQLGRHKLKHAKGMAAADA